MPESKIEPEKITKPIQLLAVWFVGLVILVGAFLGAAAAITNPTWLQAALGITAIILVPVLIGLIFVLQTKFRTQFLDDPYYAEWLKRQDEAFKNFAPENIGPSNPQSNVVVKAAETWEEREERRKRVYRDHRGLFLVHTWRPSRFPGQEADISISLHQHGEQPFPADKISYVEYHLGPMFFKHPVVKTNAEDHYRLDISAYGPVLCLARVNFNDGSPPLDLERYVNIDF